MVKTVIVSPEAIGPHKNGGIGTFATNFGILLSNHGYDVSLMYTGEMSTPRGEWISTYERHGIDVIHAKEGTIDFNSFNYEPFVRRAEVVTAKMPADVDIVYFQDWEANGFHFLRNRQFNADGGPVCVSVTHSSLQWVLDAGEYYPKS